MIQKNQPQATIDDMAWLVGHWRGEGLGGIVEENWMPPLAGTMASAFKTRARGQAHSFTSWY